MVTEELTHDCSPVLADNWAVSLRVNSFYIFDRQGLFLVHR